MVRRWPNADDFNNHEKNMMNMLNNQNNKTKDKISYRTSFYIKGSIRCNFKSVFC